MTLHSDVRFNWSSHTGLYPRRKGAGFIGFNGRNEVCEGALRLGIGEDGTHKRVKARFWPCFSGQSPYPCYRIGFKGREGALQLPPALRAGSTFRPGFALELAARGANHGN